jgi:hypothetical protein
MSMYKNQSVLAAAMKLDQNRSTASTASAESREANRTMWASGLARYTGKRRQELDLTVAEAAEQSGLEVSEWCAMEEGGWVPEELNTIRSIAASLQVRWTDLDCLAMIARHHQGR